MKNLINILKFAVFGFCCSSCADLDIPSDGRVSLNEIFNRYERTSAYYTNCLGFIPQVGFTYESTNTPLASFCDEVIIKMVLYQNGIKVIRQQNITH